jgi:hypothetical protein
LDIGGGTFAKVQSERKITMFRKSIISAMTIAILGTSAAALGTTAASAGGYGYGNNYGNGGYNGGYNNGYQQPYRDGKYSQQHVSWCQNHWKSYDPYNNTYQPYKGPRQQCYSPYYSG